MVFSISQFRQRSWFVFEQQFEFQRVFWINFFMWSLLQQFIYPAVQKISVQNQYICPLFCFNSKQFSDYMNSKQNYSAQEAAPQIQEETNENKTFSRDIFQIKYANKSQIVYQTPNTSDDIEIKNYLCYQEGSKLYKVTEILYEDKIIRITDSFDVGVDQSKVKSKQTVQSICLDSVEKQKLINKNSEKVRLFGKEVNKNGNSEKKDKKNIVKNIVRIFMAWLEKKSMSDTYQNAISILKTLLHEQNYNNRLIKNIVDSHQINKLFYQFLTDVAEDQIEASRIQDKESHYEAISVYVGLLQKKNIKDENLVSGNNSLMAQLKNERPDQKLVLNKTNGTNSTKATASQLLVESLKKIN